MNYSIRIDIDAQNDLQEGIRWYNKRAHQLGKVFHARIKKHFASLKINPFYQVRYEDVRCLPVLKFPYMIHYTIDESKKIVTVRAVFHTSQEPKRWHER